MSAYLTGYAGCGIEILVS